MTKRRQFIGLLMAGLLAAGFSASVLPASAQLRSVTVTLLDGRQLTMTVDVPPGTPLDQVQLPGVTEPIIKIVENPLPGAPPISTPAPGPAPAPSPPARGPAPAPMPAPPVGPEPNVTPKALPQARPQATTGRQKRKATAHRQGKRASSAPAASRVAAPIRTTAGIPTPANPTYSFALPTAAPLGVPDFFIQKFRVPLFLLPIYQAAGNEYGVPWQVLAAINEIETDYGRDLNVSSAGAEGWMQFLPATWKQYGVDATQSGKKDPYNPADAIFGAARYLKAAGAQKDLRGAIFAYNHASWYVDSVLLRAKLIGGLPGKLIGSLTGLTQGHFPVHASARYADDAAMPARGGPAHAAAGKHPATNIFARSGAPVIAVQDGKITSVGTSPLLGKFIQLRDAYGNTYTYANLKKVVASYPVPKPRNVSPAQVASELHIPGVHDAAPSAPATAGNQPVKPVSLPPQPASPPAPIGHATKERLFANPTRPGAYGAGGRAQLERKGQPLPATASLSSYFTQAFGLGRSDVVLKPLRKGATVIAGTILGRIGRTASPLAPHLTFLVRPAGGHTPQIDPKPVLDGWKLLESTAIYRAAGQNPFLGPDAKNPSIGQIFLMSKEVLQQRVLSDPNLSIYSCGRQDIAAGAIDRRVLTTMEFLSLSGLKPTVTALKCGHSELTTTGNVSDHVSGNAVDIAQVNGIPILGHQGPGSIADIAIRRLLTLQGLYKPDQIISLMTYPGTDNTLALPDHADHVHVGYHPLYSTDPKLAARVDSILKPDQWIKLIDRLRQIKNPVVSTTPSSAAIADTPGSGD